MLSARELDPREPGRASKSDSRYSPSLLRWNPKIKGFPKLRRVAFECGVVFKASSIRVRFSGNTVEPLSLWASF